MVFGRHEHSDDQHHRTGDGGRSRNFDDYRDIVVDQWLDGTDGDGGDVAVDCGDAGESVDHQGNDATVHRYRNVQRWDDAEPDVECDLVFGHHEHCDDQHHRTGDWRRGRNVDHQGDLGRDLWLDGADGDGGDVAVDRGDASESVDREGSDGAVYGYRNV